MAAEEVSRLTTLAVTIDPKALADFEVTPSLTPSLTLTPTPQPQPQPQP
jgi:hypothetical protein